jgi:hypothetical protein
MWTYIIIAVICISCIVIGFFIGIAVSGYVDYLRWSANVKSGEEGK